MIRTAIIGCGKVADTHASAMRRIPGCRLVGVCDREPLMARQMAERFGVEYHGSDARDLIAACQPDVAHITTPPQSHFSLARLCLENKVHVYVEKPFTLNAEEAEELIRIAEACDRKITVGQNTQFNPVAIEMRKLIRDGFLGGPPVHMESVFCYNLGDPRYARALLGDKDHWVRRLPGGLLQNIINHGIGKIVELLPGNEPAVVAHGFTSHYLKGIGELELEDELRLTLWDETQTTAYFTFSSQMAPPVHQFRVFGPRNSLIADHNHQVLIRIPGKGYKSYLNQWIPPAKLGRQYLGAAWHNVRLFFRRKLYADSGLQNLIAAFYRCIADGAPLPIPYRDIVLTTRIMDEAFRQIRYTPSKKPGPVAQQPASKPAETPPTEMRLSHR